MGARPPTIFINSHPTQLRGDDIHVLSLGSTGFKYGPTLLAEFLEPDQDGRVHERGQERTGLNQG